MRGPTPARRFAVMEPEHSFVFDEDTFDGELAAATEPAGILLSEDARHALPAVGPLQSGRSFVFDEAAFDRELAAAMAEKLPGARPSRASQILLGLVGAVLFTATLGLVLLVASGTIAPSTGAPSTRARLTDAPASFSPAQEP